MQAGVFAAVVLVVLVLVGRSGVVVWLMPSQAGLFGVVVLVLVVTMQGVVFELVELLALALVVPFAVVVLLVPSRAGLFAVVPRHCCLEPGEEDLRRTSNLIPLYSKSHSSRYHLSPLSQDS